MPGGWEWLIIIVVLVLLFGAKRLPDMARSVGQSARVFKGEMKGMRDDDDGRRAPRTPSAELPPATEPRATEPRTAESRTSEPQASEPRTGEPVRRDADR